MLNRTFVFQFLFNFIQYLFVAFLCVQDNMITVPVLYCKNDKHYHAVLPNSIIVPYSSFSIFFILKVLALKSCSAFTVEEITERFCISTSTLYRWISKYNAYL